MMGKLRAKAVNRLCLALSFLVGIAFVPLDSKLQVVAWMEMSLIGAFAAPFVILFLPILAIAAISGDRALVISISTLVGVASGVALNSISGLLGAGVLILAMFMGCLLTAPAIIAGASVGSWLKTSPSPANLFDRSSLMKFFAFAAGVLFVEILYHRSPLPFGMLSQFVLATLVVLVSMALSASSDRKPTPTVLLMMGGILLGVIVDVSLHTKVDRNLWPIEIILMWATAAPGMILGTAIGTNFREQTAKSR